MTIFPDDYKHKVPPKTLAQRRYDMALWLFQVSERMTNNIEAPDHSELENWLQKGAYFHGLTAYLLLTCFDPSLKTRFVKLLLASVQSPQHSFVALGRLNICPVILNP